jgi:IS4 transposase
MTNLPPSPDDEKAGPYSFDQIAEIYRSRWDIELFFKFIKQHLGYSHILSRTENGLQVMIYMSMITALLMIWYKRQTKNKNGWPSVRRFLVNDAAQWTAQLMETAIWVQISKKNRQLRI